MKEGWEYKKLSLVCSKISDGSHFSPKVDNNGIYPMLSVKDMMANCFNYTTCKYINENDYNVLVANGCKPKVNDVLVAKDGSYLKTAFVLKEDKEQALLSSIAIITPRLDEIVPEYLAFYFKAPHTKSVVEKHYLTGTAIKRVILKGFKNITIPVPPLSEQQHIVEELDLLSSIIEKKKAQLNELDNLAQSLFYEMFGDMGNNSKTKTIKDIAIVKIGPFGSALHKSDYISGGTPLINPVHMRDCRVFPEDDFSITNEKRKELEAYLLQTNDVIFGRRGDIGRCALITEKENGYLCGTGSLFVRFQIEINPIYCIKYLSSKFVTDYLIQNAKGATMLNLNSKIIENVPMYLPPIDLQQQFASKIEAIEHQKELIKQSIKEVETLFNSRMDYYFN